MIKHIVSWKLDDSYSPDQKAGIKEEIKEKLLALENKIEELQSIHVYFNDEAANSSNFDILLDTEFNSIDALNNYQVHPEHVKVGSYLKSLKLQRAAIDYSF